MSRISLDALIAEELGIDAPAGEVSLDALIAEETGEAPATSMQMLADVYRAAGPSPERERSFKGELLAGVVGGAYRLPAQGAGVLSAAGAGLESMIGPNMLSRAADVPRQYVEPIMDIRLQQIGQDPDRPIARALGEGATQLAFQTALGLGTGGLGPAAQVGAFAAGGVAPVVGSTFNEAVGQTGDREGAALEAAINGAVTGVTSVLPGMAILNRIPGGGALVKRATATALGRVGLAAAAEGSQEFIEQVGQEVTRDLIRLGVAPDAEYALELLTDAERWRERGIATLVGGVLGGAARGGLEALPERRGGIPPARGTPPAPDAAGRLQTPADSGVVPGIAPDPALSPEQNKAIDAIMADAAKRLATPDAESGVTPDAESGVAPDPALSQEQNEAIDAIMAGVDPEFSRLLGPAARPARPATPEGMPDDPRPFARLMGEASDADARVRSFIQTDDQLQAESRRLANAEADAAGRPRPFPDDPADDTFARLIGPRLDLRPPTPTEPPSDDGSFERLIGPPPVRDPIPVPRRPAPPAEEAAPAFAPPQDAGGPTRGFPADAAEPPSSDIPGTSPEGSAPQNLPRGKEPWEMTPSEFEREYAQHIDLRSKTPQEAEAVRQSIMAEGFRAGFNVNAMSIVQPGEKGWPARFRPKPGQNAYLLPRAGVKRGPNGLMTAAGWKPRESEVVQLSRSDESLHEAVVAKAIREGKPVPANVRALYPSVASPQDSAPPADSPGTGADPSSVDFNDRVSVSQFLRSAGISQRPDDDAERIIAAKRVVDQLGGRGTHNDLSLRHPEYRDEEKRTQLRERITSELMELPRLDDDDDIRLGLGGTLPKTPLRRERRIFIVLGPPAAGKSGIANKVADAFGARIVDGDYVKRKIPEFEDRPEGAMLTHEEADEINSVVLDRATDTGDNIVWPKLGGDPAKMLKRADNFRKWGYSVYVVGVQLPIIKSVQRATKRFLDSNRYIPLDVIMGVGTSPERTYTELRKNGYEGTAISTDVERGQPPRDVEGTPFQTLLRSARDGESGSGSGGRDARAQDRGEGRQEQDRPADRAEPPELGDARDRGSDLQRDGQPDDDGTARGSGQGAPPVRPDDPQGLDAGGADVSGGLRGGKRTGRGAGAKSRGGGVRIPSPQTGTNPDVAGGSDDPRDVGAGGSDRNPQGDVGPAPDPEPPDPAGPEDLNHIIKPGEEVAPKSASAKLAANIAAIRLLKELEAEDRNPTPGEKDILARYTGWGWGSEILNESNDRYAKQRAMLAGLMTPEELAAAKTSTLNAHYTSGHVVRAMWALARRLGFDGGRVLEPAAGSGNFLGMIPEDLAGRTRFVGVELDSLTGRLLTKLYPQADIRVQGFQDTSLANNSFDLAISNVPFGSFKIAGKDYSKLLIHDYFFARGLDKVKPGGLVLFVTSDGTLNKLSSKVRELLAEKADLVGAIRLPNTAFAENAGTQVTTDIVVLRKKGDGDFKGKAWLDTVEVGTWDTDDGPQPIIVNEYFRDHPEMALGKHSLAGTMYGRGADYALIPDPRRVGDLEKALAEAVERMPANVMGSQIAEEDLSHLSKADADARPGSYVVRDGEFVQVLGDKVIRADWLTQRAFGPKWDERIPPAVQEERKRIATDWMMLREALRNLMRAEMDPQSSDEVIADARRHLNKVYDAYTGKWGTLNRRREHDVKSNFLAQDPEYAGVQAIEVEREVSRIVKVGKNKGKAERKIEYHKGPVFTKRLRSPTLMPASAKSIDDAIAISMAFKNEIQLPVIARLLGESVESVKAKVLATGTVFEDPKSGAMQTRAEYLSGNVRKKLREAEEAAKDNPAYKSNAEALLAVIPPDVGIADIAFSLASRWMPTSVTSAFVSEHFKTQATVTYVRAANGYAVTGVEGSAVSDTTYSVQYGGRQLQSGADLLLHALNGTVPTLSRTIRTGSGTTTSPLPVETARAAQLIRQLNDEFVRWLRTSDAKVEQEGKRIAVQQVAERQYNQQMNAVVPAEYDGSHLALPGVSGTVRRLPHRMSVVARILTERAAVMAHGVGSGKTFSQIVAAMELRRLGIARKPMIVVQKSTIKQFARSFREAYPDAKILVATEKTFTAKNRKRLMAQVQYGDWDAVIVAHSQFDRIPMSPDQIRAHVQRLLWQLQEAISHEMSRMEKEGDKRKTPTLKQMEAMRESLRARLQAAIDDASSSTDQAAYFDELGVDFLMVDEAHVYKNAPIITRKRNVKGIPSGYSNRALSTSIKVEHIHRKQNGRGVVFATGTPITNTMAEAYVMLSVATPHVLQEFDITNFDEFADTFGAQSSDVEYTWSGQFKSITRFKKFRNGPELIRMIRAGFDVKMGNKELGLKVPPVKGGKPELVILPQTPAQEEISSRLLDVASAFLEAKGKDKLELTWVPIMSMQAGMAAALDPRLIDPDAADDPGSKINTAVRRIKDIYDKYTPQRGTQIVFADRFAPMNVSKLWEVVGHGGRTIHDGAIVIDTTASDPEADAGSQGDDDSDDGATPQAKAELDAYRKARFNVYKDIKAKLIKEGIPEAEIAIIHDFNTDDRREALFDKMNRGDVRVLLGSTDRAGVGVNVQERVVALHHLDPPRSMTPAMKEQRDGRVIRQGNILMEEKLSDGSPNPDYISGFEVEILQYGVEQSMDTGIWQLLENKQRFISQALMGRGVGRQFDDPADEVLMSMAEMKARLTGDARVLRMVELKKQVQDLDDQFEGHTRAIAEHQTSMRNQEFEVSWQRSQVETERQRSARLRKLGDFTEIQVEFDGNRAVGEDASKKLLKSVYDAAARDGEAVVQINGARWVLTRVDPETVGGAYRFQATHSWNTREEDFNSKKVVVKAPSPGNLIRGIGELPDIGAGWLRGAQAKLAEAEGRMAVLEARKFEPFPAEAELRKLQEELARLERELAAPPGKKSTGQGTARPTQSEKPPRSLVEMLERVEQSARSRMQARSRAMGTTLYSGFDPTLLAQLGDVAIIAAARALRAGVRQGRRLTKIVREVIAEFRPGADETQVRKIARGLITDAAAGDGGVNADGFERAVDAMRRRMDRLEARERPKRTIERETGVEASRPSKAGETPLQVTLGAAEKAATRAWRAGRQAAIAELRPRIEGIRTQMRAEMARRVADAKARGEAAVDREKIRAEVIQGIRDQILGIARTVPLPVRGVMVTDVAKATTFMGLIRASRRAQKAIYRFQAREAYRRLRRLSGAKRARRLTQERRDRLAEAYAQGTSAYLRAVPPRKAPRPDLNQLRVATDQVIEAMQTAAEIHAEHQAEVRTLKALRGMSIQDAAAAAAKNIRAAKDPLAREAREESPEVSWVARRRRGALDFRGALELVEGVYDDSGVLFRTVWRSLTRAEERYFALKRDLTRDVEQALQRAGYASLSAAFDGLTRVGGVDERVVSVRLGGKARKIGLGEAINLLANATDPDTYAQIIDGVPIQFGGGKFNDPIEVTADDLAELAVTLRQYIPLIVAFKGILDSTRPAVFRAHFQIKGYEPIRVRERWPRQRNLEAVSRDIEIPSGAAGFAVAALENMGFLKERSAASNAPIVINDVLNVMLEAIDNSAKVAHLAVPIRDAAGVLLHPDVRSSIAERWGPGMWRSLRNQLWEASRANTVLATGGAILVHELNANIAVSTMAANPRTWARTLAGAIRLAPILGAKHFVAGVRAAKDVTFDDLTRRSGYFWDRYVGNPAGRLSAVMAADAPEAPTLLRAAKLTSRNLRAGRVGDAYRSWRRTGRKAMEIINFFDSIIGRIALAGFRAKARDEHPEWSQARRDRWAIERAAGAIRETQNGSSPLDLSMEAAQNRNSGLAAFFLFTSEPFKTYNRLRRAKGRGRADFVRTAGAEAAQIAIGIMAAQAIGWTIASGVSAALGGDDEDQARINERFWAPQRLLLAAANDLLGALGMPIVGGAVVQSLYAATQGGSRGNELSPAALDVLQQLLSAGVNLGRAATADDEERADRFVRALEQFVSAAFTATGLNPLQAAWRMLWGEAKQHLAE